MHTRFAAVVLFTLASSTARSEPILYKIDSAHTAVAFRIKHLGMAHVTGTFTGVEGEVLYDDNNPSATTVNATIDMSTLTTGVLRRDAHLKSADFFDVARYPRAVLKATHLEKVENGLKLSAALTIKDVTRPVTLVLEPPSAPIKNPAGAVVRGTSATTRIVRKDWNLTWNKVVEGVELVGPDAVLTIDVELIRRAEQPRQ